MSSIDAYMAQVNDDRLAHLQMLMDTINAHMPKGFHHQIQDKMPAWVVPLDTFPAGYHCAKDTPLPFCSVANRKNFIALYHMGIYSDPDLLAWFQQEYPKHSKYKLDIGKSCIRFKKVEHIPYELIGQLMEKMTVEDWVTRYQAGLKGT